jgi:hypothetical protein
MDDKVLVNRHTYHAPVANQITRFQAIRDAALDMSRLINSSCPDSHEKDRALDAVDLVVFNANAAIARHEHE